jgi:kinetochore protein Mis18
MSTKHTAKSISSNVSKSKSSKEKSSSTTTSEIGDNEEQQEISGPLVFSCSKCRTIVGDSYSFLSSNEDMQTITLTAASNIQRSADVYTSTVGSDIGSTYFSFSCINCNASLGRYYLTTSSDLDDLRSKFTYNVGVINSYELGKSQHGKMPDLIELNNNNNEIDEDQSNVNLKVKESLTSLNDEVFKVQRVIMDLLERVSQLESQREGLAMALVGDKSSVKRSRN